MPRQKTKVSQQAVSVPKLIALIDTHKVVAYETLGTVESTHDSTSAAFKRNDAFQARMRASGETHHIITKIVTLKKSLNPGDQVKPSDLADNTDRQPKRQKKWYFVTGPIDPEP